MASPYKITIPTYEGPLDLLLDLIKKQEMNIHDIQISKITSQYLDYLHKLEELNIDISADFIYMAATLIYIKSKMLLPPEPRGAVRRPARRAHPAPRRTRKIQKRRSAALSKAASRGKRLVQARQIAL
jgi:chromatin segregation and condensation protein Rec8/ScpA/Scc1 (kleisin family)